MNNPKDHWNQRFSAEEYAYGTQPNAFFAEQLKKLEPGKLLLPAEGEGRNAVFAAMLGWDVVAFDISEEGCKKAQKLAKANGVTIDYRLYGYDDFDPSHEKFDCIGLVFAHTAAERRRDYHHTLASALKPGGKLILQGFSKAQLGKDSGGPKALGMLFSEEELRTDFEMLENISVAEKQVSLDEGPYHQGTASVIEFIAQAPSA